MGWVMGTILGLRVVVTRPDNAFPGMGVVVTRPDNAFPGMGRLLQ